MEHLNQGNQLLAHTFDLQEIISTISFTKLGFKGENTDRNPRKGFDALVGRSK